MLPVLLTTALGSTPTGFDYDAWERVLTKHVKPGAIMGARTNVVDYFGIAEDPDFATAVESLAKADFSDPSWNESMALGCNAYTISVVNTYVKHPCRYSDDGKCLGPNYGMPGINEDKTTAFDDENFVIGGKNFSINAIEDMLRPITKEPLFSASNAGKAGDIRAHACMTCGGISCPDLRFYRDTTIDEDLSYAAEQWMLNPYKGNRINRTSNTVYFSHIMKWYKDEFDANGGVMKAFAPYFSKPMTDFLESSNGVYNVSYLGYVWDANGPIPCDCTPPVDDPEAFVEVITQGPTAIDVLGSVPTCHIAREE